MHTLVTFGSTLLWMELLMGPNFPLPQPVYNRILFDLPRPDLHLIRPSLKPVQLVPGQVLIEQGQPAEYVYFLENGVIAVLAKYPGGKASVQVAMIGREGFVGGQALLDADVLTSTSAVVQFPGPALRMTVRDLHVFMGQSCEFRQRCLTAVAAQMSQIMETSASNACDSLAVRCARWLLMVHDRVGDELVVTHEALSTMLGVRRSGVTVTLTALQEETLIYVQRGRITILDRAGLERAASMAQLAQSAGWMKPSRSLNGIIMVEGA